MAGQENAPHLVRHVILGRTTAQAVLAGISLMGQLVLVLKSSTMKSPLSKIQYSQKMTVSQSLMANY